jgi:hypothetical protein
METAGITWIKDVLELNGKVLKEWIGICHITKKPIKMCHRMDNLTPMIVRDFNYSETYCEEAKRCGNLSCKLNKTETEEQFASALGAKPKRKNRNWLKDVLQSRRPFMSNTDIDWSEYVKDEPRIVFRGKKEN